MIRLLTLTLKRLSNKGALWEVVFNSDSTHTLFLSRYSPFCKKPTLVRTGRLGDWETWRLTVTPAPRHPVTDHYKDAYPRSIVWIRPY
jgi:hypothetical protein